MALGLNLVPSVAAFIAFILGTLCLFAGQEGFIVQASIMTLQTPSLGAGISEFYSVYVMSYCQGVLEQSTSNGSTSIRIQRNVDYCSNRSLPFWFDANAVLSGDITTPSVSLASLGFPSSVGLDFDACATTSETMTVFYVIGAATAGLALLAQVAFTVSRLGRKPLIEVGLLTLSFFSLGIASTIASVIATEFISLVNADAVGSPVSASPGSQFLAMSWTAVIFLSVATASTVLVGQGQQSSEPEPPTADDKEAEE